MNKLETVELTGQSGEDYTFTLYDVLPFFNRPVPCVYYVCKRYLTHDGETLFKPIYIGQTEDFDKCFDNHQYYPFFKRHQFNCVAILPLHDPNLRAGVKLDLINGLRPLHNNPPHPDWQPCTRDWPFLAAAR